MKTSRTVLLWISVCFSAAFAQTGSLTTIYSFNGNQDGAFPDSPLVLGENGELYGTTEYGGYRGPGCGEFFRCGTFYKLTPPVEPGGAWTETILIQYFGGPYGVWHPYGPLVKTPNGVLYATGESMDFGAVYALIPPQPGSLYWGDEVIYNFTRETPVRGLGEVTVGPDGVIYVNAGTDQSQLGTIVALQPPSSPGGAWTPIYFQPRDDGSGGTNPTTPLAAGGLVYDAMNRGGAFGFGAVVSLNPPSSNGGAWAESVLYSFQGTGDGSYPSGLVNGGTELLYGTTYSGGLSGCSTESDNSCGVIFQLSKTDGLNWAESLVYAFPFDGFDPGPGLPTVTSGGVLYGTFSGSNSCGTGAPCGAIYQLTPPASAGAGWTESTVYNFTGGADGMSPSGPLTVGQDGALYGITYFGGSANCNLYNSPAGCGTVFRFVP
jgi:hypothetical protein